MRYLLTILTKSSLLLPIFLTGCKGLCRKILANEIAISTGGPIDPQSMIIGKVWWMVPIGILGVAAGSFLLAQGSLKLGLAVVIGCGVALGLSITVFQHFALIAWFGFGLAAVGIFYAVYQAYLHRKAIAELVKTGEAAKLSMSAKAKAVVFGAADNEGDHGAAGTIQSKATEKLVAKERKQVGG